jgi:hypothetical protein
MPEGASNLKAIQFIKQCIINKGSGEFLDHALNSNRCHNDASALPVHAADSVGRFLLVLAAVELISMPLTQYAWTWDHFLQGGMDFESSLLFLVVCLGLLLVLRQHCRQAGNLQVPKRWLSLPSFNTGKSTATLGTRAFLPIHRELRASSDLAKCYLPLQI